jgi:hypothetical protein
MKVLVMMMMVMMIPMKFSTMVMTMATISPLREGFFPADFCLPESFSLSVFSALWWRGVDDVNDQPVENPKRRCEENSSKFSLS